MPIESAHRLDQIAFRLMTRAPAIFVINLAQRADRRAAMQRQLAKIGWSGAFFGAICPADPAGFPTAGARGCFLSHLAVLKNAQMTSAPFIVILEDDLNFSNGFAEQWQAATSALAALEWSIFYAGHAMARSAAGLLCVDPETGIQCTHFMAINRPALAKVIAGLETILSRRPGHPLGGPMHLDGAYSTLRAQNHGLVTYAYFPALGYQRPSRTDVGNQRWFDTSFGTKDNHSPRYHGCRRLRTCLHQRRIRIFIRARSGYHRRPWSEYRSQRRLFRAEVPCRTNIRR
jgi:glycosyl transferase family 25